MPSRSQSGRQVIDRVAQLNHDVVGFGPSIAMIHAYLAQSHALSLVLTNSLSQQQQLASVGLATTATSVTQLFSKKRRRRRRNKQKRTEQEEPRFEHAMPYQELEPAEPADFVASETRANRAGEATADMMRLESHPTHEERGYLDVT